jgi:hypothetical protein
MLVRRNYRDLSPDERDRLVQALYHVKSTGLVDQFASDHATHFNHGIHRSSHFLPWHREFVRRFEVALQAFHPEIAIPYWDSTVDTSSSDPLWDNAFLGQFNASWGLNRRLRVTSSSSVLPTPQRLQQTQRLDQYAPYWPDLERAIHNPPHNWVGGVMASAASPGDPVFYFHHCWIDLLWAEWQVKLGHAGPAFFTASGPGVGLNDPLMGWTTTAADVLDHRSLGYDYDRLLPPL